MSFGYSGLISSLVCLWNGAGYNQWLASQRREHPSLVAPVLQHLCSVAFVLLCSVPLHAWCKQKVANQDSEALASIGFQMFPKCVESPSGTFVWASNLCLSLPKTARHICRTRPSRLVSLLSLLCLLDLFCVFSPVCVCVCAEFS